MRALTFPLVVTLAVVALGHEAQAQRPPWYPRRVEGLLPNRIARARIGPDEWPVEPRSPEVVDIERLAHALETACDWMPPGRPLRYATWVERYATEFEVDPFLLAAVMFRRTGGTCRPDLRGEHGEVGLTQILRRVYAEHWEDRAFHFHVREGGAWVEREIEVPRWPFAPPRLRRAEESLYFGAAILRFWREQEESLRGAFEQVPYRHYVSHFVWGDRVRSDRQEDRILTDRRRLLEYYGARAPLPPVERLGVLLQSPLDGAPRVVSSGIGDVRDGGNRRHRGIDFESLPNEPVRAAASGHVVFAGVDLPGAQVHRQLRPHQYDTVPRDELANGGRFVCIRHPRGDREPLRTCYMHLERVDVAAGEDVDRGDLIGTVGRTGMERSAAHLHFEIHGEDGVLDPLPILRPLVLGNPSPEL